MKCVQTIVFATLVILFIFPIPVRAQKGAMSDQDIVQLTQLELRGTELSEAEVRALEDRLEKNPDDLAARLQLVSYYAVKGRSLDSARAAYQTHAIWMIQHHPDAPYSGSAFMTLDPVSYGNRYAQAKNLWLEQVKAHPKDAAVLRNAARFFLIRDGILAEDLLKRAKQLEPNNPEWSEQLGQLYRLRARTKSRPKSRREVSAKSLAEFERALQGADPIKRYSELPYLAKVAFEAEEFDKARPYASELLEKANKDKKSWNYGNAVHDGNLVLGRLALKAGNIDQAKEYLMKAGNTPGSPQLNSFGPTMTLAKELIEHGEHQTVLEYFKLCGNFWKMDNGRLAQWTATVRKGSVPNFGANLDY